MSKKFLIIIFFSIVFLRLVSLGLYPLTDKTESRYAEISREMVVTGNWITPQLNPGEPFWGKPPLAFWLTAVIFKCFGVNEFTARLSSFLLALFISWLILLLGKELKDDRYSWLTLIILWSTDLYYLMAGNVMTDMALLATLIISFVSFYLTIEHEHQRKSYDSYLFFVGIGLSLLAKGPVGVVLICLPIFIWLILTQQWKKCFRSFNWIFGTLLVLIIAIPWYILAEQQTPGFLRYFIIGEHWERFTVSGWRGDLYGTGHAYPRGTIWLYGFLSIFPWVFILLLTINSRWKAGAQIKSLLKNRFIMYLLSWIVAPLIFFTLSKNISFHYVLPILPPIALLLAYLIKTDREGSRKSQHSKWYLDNISMGLFMGFVPILCFVALLTFLKPILNDKSHKYVAAVYYQLRPNPDSKIFYLTEVPESIRFYTENNASYIPDFNVQLILQKLHDHKQDFFVFKMDESHRVPKEFWPLTRQIGQHAEHMIFLETKDGIEFKKKIE